MNATSAGVSGLPLFHFTPWRIVKVSDVPPVPQLYEVASHGVYLGGAARSNCSSGS